MTWGEYIKSEREEAAEEVRAQVLAEAQVEIDKANARADAAIAKAPAAEAELRKLQAELDKYQKIN